MILEIILQLSGTTLFFLTGLFLSYLLFSKCDIIERVCYSIALSVCSITILGFLLYLTGAKSQFILAALVFLLVAVLLFFVLRKKNAVKTLYNKDLLFVLLFSAIGALWRYWFVNSAVNFGDSYKYAGLFSAGNAPNAGFYTGMIKDHSNYYSAISAVASFFNFFSIENLSWLFSLPIITFLYLGFIYILARRFREEKIIAYSSVALLALGPVEIFHSTLSFFGHPISYIALFSLFLLFKSKDNNIQPAFWLAFFLSAYSLITYYTASIVIILACFGFVLALCVKKFVLKKNGCNLKLIQFMIIFLFSLLYVFLFSNMANFTVNSVKNIQPLLGQNLTFLNYTLYKDPAFLGLSAIRWQILFLFLCGLTFLLYLFFKRDFSKENIDLLLCLIPVLIVSFAFFLKNVPTRIFDYFAFFGLIALMLPKKYFKIFLIVSFVFIVFTSFAATKDKKIFFENPQAEINAAKEISKQLNGTIFCDQEFASLLITNGYYNVAGVSDDSPILIGLFYSENKDDFLRSIKTLEKNEIDYIAITQKMRQKYILMENYPKKPIFNFDLYEKYLPKVYDNGDVKIFSTKINT